jgi:hypothetical protein
VRAIEGLCQYPQLGSSHHGHLGQSERKKAMNKLTNEEINEEINEEKSSHTRIKKNIKNSRGLCLFLLLFGLG